MSADDQLQDKAGGGQEQPAAGAERLSGDALADLVGGLLGGQGQAGGDALAGVMGDLLAGQERPQPAAPGTMLGGLGDGLDQVLAPLSEQLAARPGLPPEAAKAVVSFVLGRLLGRGSAGEGAGRLDLGDVLRQSGSKRGLDQEYVRATGVPQELAAKSGMDLDQAVEAVQQVLALLMGQQAEATKPKKPKAKAKAKAKPKSTAKAKAKTTTKAKAKSKAKAKPKSAAKAKAKSKPKAKPKAAAKAKPKSASKSKT